MSKLPSVPAGFHYDREQRLALPGAPRPRRRGTGLLRGNRSLAILLIDVVAIAVLFVIVSRFLVGTASSDRLGAYRVRIVTEQIGAMTVATVELTNPRVLRPAPGGSVRARFSVPGSADALVVGGELPVGPGEQSELAVLFRTPASVIELVARVFIGDESSALVATVGSD